MALFWRGTWGKAAYAMGNRKKTCDAVEGGGGDDDNVRLGVTTASVDYPQFLYTTNTTYSCCYQLTYIHHLFQLF